MSSSKLDYLSKYTSEKKSKKDKKKKSKKTKRPLYVDEDGDDFVPPEPIEGLGDDGPTIVVNGELNALNELPDNLPLESMSVEDEARSKKRKKNKSKERRQRYDSDDGSPPPRDRSKSNKSGRMRHDSDDDIGSGDKLMENRDAQRRYDSDDEAEGGRTRRKRYDSDDDDGSSKRNTTGTRRHDSDDQSSERNVQLKRKRFDSDDENSDRSNSRKMTSGHNAGLQSSDRFKQTEQKIRQKKLGTEEKLERGETVYRNKDGKELDDQDSKKNYDDKESDPLWNLGAVQKRQILAISEERNKMSEGTFARTVNEVDLYQKDILRADDPMAKQSRDYGNKKIYKGPQPKPNRFGIRPGYRWDGIDRGNGFEDQVLGTIYAKGRKNEDRYKWSCADM
jgi:pre-mRNA-splicing factor CWC26